jgi:hypothetical protein
MAVATDSSSSDKLMAQHICPCGQRSIVRHRAETKIFSKCSSIAAIRQCTSAMHLSHLCQIRADVGECFVGSTVCCAVLRVLHMQLDELSVLVNQTHVIAPGGAGS